MYTHRSLAGELKIIVIEFKHIFDFNSKEEIEILLDKHYIEYTSFPNINFKDDSGFVETAKESFL
ncbi:MAG: hypothetical protein ACEQR7_05095, partial [Agathobacter rectalis]